MGMGSMMESSDAIPSDSVIPKSEFTQDGYTSSSASTPEADAGAVTQEVVQVQKRKGGRKPVFLIKLSCALRSRLTHLPDICHF